MRIIGLLIVFALGCGESRKIAGDGKMTREDFTAMAQEAGTVERCEKIFGSPSMHGASSYDSFIMYKNKTIDPDNGQPDMDATIWFKGVDDSATYKGTSFNNWPD